MMSFFLATNEWPVFICSGDKLPILFFPKVSRQYIDVELLYLVHGGTIHAIDKDKMPAVQDLLTDRREELKNYISDQQLKLRSADDLVKLVKKYNELHQ